MFTILLKKEVYTQLVTTKGVIVLVIVITLSMVSTLVMQEGYALRVKNFELLKADGTGKIMRQPNPMSILVSSLDDRISGKVGIRDFGDISVGRTQRSLNRIFDYFSTLDLHFVVFIVMSLASVLFTFDSISGEKENQTLKAILSNSVSRDKVLLAKWLGAVVVLSLPLAICFLISLAIIIFTQPTVIDLVFVFRTGLLFLVSLAFCSVFAGIGLLISVLTSRPSISLIGAVLVWCLLVFVLPPAVASFSATITRGKTIAQYSVEKTNMWAEELFKIANNPDMERGSEAFDRAFLDMSFKYVRGFKEYISQEEERIAFSRTLSQINPVGVFHFAFWDIGGSGPEDILRYKKQIINYQPIVCQEIYDQKQLRRADPSRGKATPVLFSEERRTPGDIAINSSLPAVGVFILEIILLFQLIHFAFARYDIR